MYGATDATSPTTLALLSTPEMVLAVFFGSYDPTQLLPVSTLIIVSEMTLVSVAAEGTSCSKKQTIIIHLTRFRITKNLLTRIAVG